MIRLEGKPDLSVLFPVTTCAIASRLAAFTHYSNRRQSNSSRSQSLENQDASRRPGRLLDRILTQ